MPAGWTEQISCVIFDAGGVLYTLDYEAAWNGFFARSGLTRNGLTRCGLSRDDVLRAITADDIFISFETGRITAQMYFDALKERLGGGRTSSVRFPARRPSHDFTFEEFVSTWNSVLVRREDMFELLRSLKRLVRIAVLSNTNEINAAAMNGELSELTGDVIYSFQVGLMKPDPEIYRLAANRIGCPPSRILFVDDLRENVEGALEAGMHGHLFRDRKLLVESIRKFGIPVS